MKRLVIFAILIAAIGLGTLSAQEITGFKAPYVNKRYEISFSVPGGSQDSRYDIFFFVRDKGQESWVKAVTILGDYRNLPPYHNGTIYWDPFFDFRKEGNYEFKIYALSLSHVNQDYSYSKVNQVGVLRLYSNQSGAVYRIGGKDLLTTDLLALPVGNYQVSLLQGSTEIETRTVGILPFRVLEEDLSPRYGNLRLSSSVSGALYAVGTGEFSNQTSYRLKIGTHNVRVSVPQSNSAYPPLSSQADLLVEENKETVYRFEIPYGSLDLNSDLEQVSYQVQGKDFQEVRGMMLQPGSLEVRAISDQNYAKKTQILSKTLSITNGASTIHRFNFGATWGFLSVTTPSPASFLTLNTIKLELQDAFKLPEGTYQVTAVMPDGKAYGPAEVKVLPGQLTVHKFGGDPSDEPVTVKKPKKRGQEIFKWPLSDFSILGVLSDANPLPDPDNPSDPTDVNDKEQDLSVGLACIGVVETKLMKHLGSLHYYASVGVLDQLYFLLDTRSEKTSFAIDAFSLGGGAGISAFRDRIYLELSAKGSLTTQTPLYRSLTLYSAADTMDVKYRYAVSLKDENVETLTWGGAFQAKARLQYRLAKMANVYLYAAYRMQTTNSGKWYRDDELSAWENDGGPKPSAQSDIRFPERNTVFKGDSLIFGLGFSLVAW